jgi:RHS repeat-associated protein
MILSDSRRQYTWDAAERLLSISNSGVSNAVKLAFQYYPDGRRAQKTVSCFTNNAWVVTRSLHYAWQGWKLTSECERNGEGSITAVRHFVWGPDIAGQQSASLESEAEGVGGLLLIREWKPVRGMKQYLPLTDGLGNISGLIDATDGSLAAEYDYDPYGGPVIERGLATEACPFRHRTRYYDSESWLYYYGYRYYDPSTTKWISKDPLAEAGGWNLTCFCDNDPVNKADPIGLMDLPTHGNLTISSLRQVKKQLGLTNSQFNDLLRGAAEGSSYPDTQTRVPLPPGCVLPYLQDARIYDRFIDYPIDKAKKGLKYVSKKTGEANKAAIGLVWDEYPKFYDEGMNWWKHGPSFLETA